MITRFKLTVSTKENFYDIPEFTPHHVGYAAGMSVRLRWGLKICLVCARTTTAKRRAVIKGLRKAPWPTLQGYMLVS